MTKMVKLDVAAVERRPPDEASASALADWARNKRLGVGREQLRGGRR